MIDEHIRHPWPREVKEALAKFRQGDVVTAPPFFYGHGGATRLWDVGSDAASDEHDASASAVEELHPDDAPPYGIITSQTCDLDEQGDPPLQPWFQVSPVYALSEGERAGLASKQFIYELDGGDLPEGHWVADLRIELPVEKSFLSGREPVRGFSSEAAAEAFGREIGRRRARATLANRLVDNVIALLRGRRSKRRGMWRNQVFRLMLEIEGGTRLEPAAVRLHVITREEPSGEVRDFFDTWEDEARQPAEAAGIELWATEYHDSRGIELARYDAWLELNLP